MQFVNDRTVESILTVNPIAALPLAAHVGAKWVVRGAAVSVAVALVLLVSTHEVAAQERASAAVNRNAGEHFEVAINRRLRGDFPPDQNAGAEFLRLAYHDMVFCYGDSALRLYTEVGLDEFSPNSRTSQGIFFDERFILKTEPEVDDLAARRDRAFELQQHLRQATRIPWNAETFPTLHAWIAENASALDVLRDSSLTAECLFLPLHRGDDDDPYSFLLDLTIDTWHVVALRQLLARATLRDDSHAFGSKWADIHAVMRSARLMRITGRVHADVVRGQAIEDEALATAMSLVASSSLSPDDVARIVRDLDELPALSELRLDNLLCSIRLSLMELIDFFARNDAEITEVLIEAERTHPIWNYLRQVQRQSVQLPTVLQEIERLFEEVEGTSFDTGYEMLSSKYRDLTDRAPRNRARAEERAHQVAAGLAYHALKDAWFKVPAAQTHNVRQIQFAKINIGLVDHWRHSGHFPESLSEVTAEYGVEAIAALGMKLDYTLLDNGYKLVAYEIDNDSASAERLGPVVFDIEAGTLSWLREP